MGLFTTRPSLPVDARERQLNEEIARLEKEIAALKRKPAKARPASALTAPRGPSSPLTKTARISGSSAPGVAPSGPVETRIVPDTLEDIAVVPVPLPPTPPPNLHTTAANTSAKTKVPPPAPATPTLNDPHFNEFGERKFDLGHWIHGLLGTLNRPPAGSSNPNMVKYLATGSVQGLRPLKYERRIARNRTIGLVTILLVVLYGLAWVFFRH